LTDEVGNYFADVSNAASASVTRFGQILHLGYFWKPVYYELGASILLGLFLSHVIQILNGFGRILCILRGNLRQILTERIWSHCFELRTFVGICLNLFKTPNLMSLMN